MNVSENCIERKRHPVPIGRILIPLDNQRKWADLRYWHLSISWTVWKRTCFETDGLRELEFLENFHCSSRTFPLPTMNCPGTSWTHYSFLWIQRKAVSCVFQVAVKFVFKAKLPLPSSQMMDFVFLLPEGPESGHFVFISPHGHFLLPTPGPSPCLREEISGSGAVTSVGSDTILEAFVRSFP